MQKLTGQFKKRVCEPGGLPVQTLRRAAFFDVDGTLIKGDSQELEARYFIRHTLVSPGYAFSILLTLAALQLNRVGCLSLSRQNEIYLKTYRGQAAQALADQAQNLFTEVICNRFFPGVLDLLKRHRQEGDLIVLVSATTRHLLVPFDQMLKPDLIFCTDLEFDPNGFATGRAVDGICAEEKKQEIVQTLAREKDLDLSASYAYSDHHSDIPFLSSVGHPEVVNPTKKMAGYAREKGWSIHRFD